MSDSEKMKPIAIGRKDFQKKILLLFLGSFIGNIVAFFLVKFFLLVNNEVGLWTTLAIIITVHFVLLFFILKNCIGRLFDLYPASSRFKRVLTLTWLFSPFPGIYFLFFLCRRPGYLTENYTMSGWSLSSHFIVSVFISILLSGFIFIGEEKFNFTKIWNDKKLVQTDSLAKISLDYNIPVTMRYWRRIAVESHTLGEKKGFYMKKLHQEKEQFEIDSFIEDFQSNFNNRKMTITGIILGLAIDSLLIFKHNDRSKDPINVGLKLIDHQLIFFKLFKERSTPLTLASPYGISLFISFDLWLFESIDIMIKQRLEKKIFNKVYNRYKNILDQISANKKNLIEDVNYLPKLKAIEENLKDMSSKPI